MKHVMILVLSRFPREDREPEEAVDETGAFRVRTVHTNEPAVQYMCWRLDTQEGGSMLDRVFAFVTSNQEEDLDRFQKLLPGVEIEGVLLQADRLQGIMSSLTTMYDRLAAYQARFPQETVRIHVDITGGPRQASMMMLPLIQMLRYSDMEVGRIVYTNILAHQKTVEDASGLMDVFSLVGGAEEFVSLGSVRQFKQYFAGSTPPLRIQNLLDRMEEFAELLHVCGNYQTTEAALERLGAAIKRYTESVDGDMQAIGAERLFNRLLPRIRHEYRDVLPQDGQPRTPMAIIRWCLAKGLLQQAITFFTEWLPPYLLDSGLLTVHDREIVRECKKEGKQWSSWGNHLLRAYQPQADPQDELVYAVVMPTLQQGDWKNFKRQVSKGRSAAWTALTQLIETFVGTGKVQDFPQRVLALPEKDPVRRIMELSFPKNTTFESYLSTRIDKEKEQEKVILKALLAVPKDQLDELLTGKTILQGTGKKIDWPRHRRKIFEQLLERGKISTRLPQENLLAFVEQFEYFVSSMRNSFAHANSSLELARAQDARIQEIRQCLSQLETGKEKQHDD